MINIDTPLDRAGVTRMVVIKGGSVQQRVQVTKGFSRSRSHVGVPVEDWDWGALRDYVVGEIEQRFGTWPRDQRKEAAIFKSFLGRWGVQAGAIARHAFEIMDGRWLDRPITVNSFCKGSDPYFARPIMERLSR